MFTLDDTKIFYYGENKVGGCAEVMHDWIRCLKNALDSKVECKLLSEDYLECRERTKQRAAYDLIINSMDNIKPPSIWKVIFNRLTR